MRSLRRALPRAALLLALAGSAHTEDASAGIHAARVGEMHAAQITAENAAVLRVGGSDAIGGLGDWALGNGTLCAVVSDPSHESVLSPRGGVLIDLAHCGRNDDQWNVLQPLVNLSRELVVPVTEVRAEGPRPDGSVALVSQGDLLGLAIETRYGLNLERPAALRITTRVRRRSGAAEKGRVFLFGEVVLHGRRQLAPFTLALSEIGSVPLANGSLGFVHPPIDPDSTLAMVRAIVPANLQVLVGGDALEPGISYGLHLVGAWLESADGGRHPLPHLAINGEDFSLLGLFTHPFWVGGSNGLGLLELAQTLLMDIEPGDTLQIEREILVGRRADVASVTDLLWSNAPWVQGQVEASARIHVHTRSSGAVTYVRPAPDGSFGFRVPEGSYALRVRASGGREVARMIEVGPSGLDLGRIPLDAPAQVTLPRGQPMRLVFRPDDGASKPRLGDDLLGFQVGGDAIPGSTQADHVSLGGIQSDPSQVTLPPGRYTVFATRGPEFSVTRASLEARSGVVTPLSIPAPVRVLYPGDWLGADLHVHAMHSDDSSLPLQQRLTSFMAAGADVIVSTEHDRVIDYGPLLRQLGLADRLASMVGVEVTSTVRGPGPRRGFGHANAYPLPFRPLEYRGGAPNGEARRLRELVADVHALGEGHLVQLNHPRSKSGEISDLNFFTHLSVAGAPYQPEAPLRDVPNRSLLERDTRSGLRDLDFDVMELMNGDAMPQYRATRADWYSLLLQGEFRPGVANSDSHGLGELVALPRTYVHSPAKAAKRFDEPRFIEALRAGRAYGSTGPLLELHLRGAAGPAVGIGELFSGDHGTLELVARTASWVPISRMRVLVDGVVVEKGPIRPNERRELALDFAADAFVTVEVSGDPGPVYAAVAPGFEPFAFSNPIFVDADGDGRWTATGLPAESLPILHPTR
jgi:hypothetical protein